MELSGSLLPNYVSFYSCVYYYQLVSMMEGLSMGVDGKASVMDSNVKKERCVGVLNDSPMSRLTRTR